MALCRVAGRRRDVGVRHSLAHVAKDAPWKEEVIDDTYDGANRISDQLINLRSQKLFAFLRYRKRHAR